MPEIYVNDKPLIVSQKQEIQLAGLIERKKTGKIKIGEVSYSLEDIKLSRDYYFRKSISTINALEFDFIEEKKKRMMMIPIDRAEWFTLTFGYIEFKRKGYCKDLSCLTGKRYSENMKFIISEEGKRQGREAITKWKKSPFFEKVLEVAYDFFSKNPSDDYLPRNMYSFLIPENNQKQNYQLC
jgi:hypothetical protein